MTIKTTDLDRIFASEPVNQTAAQVSGPGEHFEPKMPIGTLEHFTAPPPMLPLKYMKSPGHRAVARQMIGRRFGRLRVVGYAKNQPPRLKKGRGKKGVWVVRCDCGDYEHRTAKAIRNPNNTEDCCRKCDTVRQQRRRYEKNGAKPLSYFLKPPLSDGENDG